MHPHQHVVVYARERADQPFRFSHVAWTTDQPTKRARASLRCKDLERHCAHALQNSRLCGEAPVCLLVGGSICQVSHTDLPALIV